MTEDWTTRARQLADQLTADGVLHDQRWHRALTAVPRHRLAPRIYQQTGTAWQLIDGDDPAQREQWLAAVYANTGLVTALAEENGQQVTRSSTTTPSLMIRMLEALDLDGGHRVLEIGTGTGYNAALLAHALGAANVYSVDVDRDLVDLARDRLAALGIRPTLLTADGAAGLPEHGPYDRIIATCALPTVPWSWAGQLHVGGIALVDVKPLVNAGNLVRLHRKPDRLEGRFLPKWATFMPMRSAQFPLDAAAAGYDHRVGRLSATSLPASPFDNLVAWFLAHFHLPAGIWSGLRLDQGTGEPVAHFLTATDGSWYDVELAAEDGYRKVRQGGAQQLWSHLETALLSWRELGRPGWERFGMTVTPDATWIWLDHPAHRIGELSHR
ncbi:MULTISPECIES: methyltransferase domain-containing protein [unclassified Crossiella]|uniref:methyltransferase domain-containing protein n=1 Tax=unclassified Crossiella TaxID=2620835 RepID=UPI001FFF2BF8|nr:MULTISPECIES: methyltransferase domain-containing protein [unclassified Crossiella]MCK2241782.1 methyltransferase domain-containing protein [Crossiella sp. S99.2]MCK2255346.1 methyltransferase domain-containing protein [Crossiella sp. S99.1]